MIFNVATEEPTAILIEEPEETAPTTQPDTIELTQPIPDEISIITECHEVTEKPKKKKTVKKVKKTAEDDYLAQLMEAEIPKTKLEKYEKIELEYDNKPKEKPKEEIPQPIPVQRKDKKPIQVEAPIAEELQPTKLKPKKTKPVEKEIESVILPTRRLKSRLTKVSYPPEPQRPVFTELNSVRQNGDLSRTIAEAEEVLKKKTKKFKHIKKRKDSLEKPDLEIYERYVSSSDEEAESLKYKRAEKLKQPDEPDHQTLKLGKGKNKPQEEEVLEIVKLKKTPVKPVEVSKDEVVIQSKKEELICTHTGEIKNVDFDLEEFKPSTYEHSELTKNEYVSDEAPSDVDIKSTVDKPKTNKKKKTKPEPETVQSLIIPGIPKTKEDSPDKDVSFKYAQKPIPNEDDENVMLKPFSKHTTTEEPEIKIIEQTITAPRVASPELVEEKLKIKKKKSKIPTDEPDAITLILKQTDNEVPDIVTVEKDVIFVVQPMTKPSPAEEEVSEKLKLKTTVPTTIESAAATLTIDQHEEELPMKSEENIPIPVEVTSEPLVSVIKTMKVKTTTNLKKQDEILPLNLPTEEITNYIPEELKEFVVKAHPKSETAVEELPESIKITEITAQHSEVPEDNETIIIRSKDKSPAPVEQKITIKKKEQPSIDEQDDVTLKLKKETEKTSDIVVDDEEDLEYVVQVKPKPVIDVDEAFENLKIKQPTSITDESADAELTIVQPEDIPVEIPEEVAKIEKVKLKPKKYKKVEEPEDEEYVVQVKPKLEIKDVNVVEELKLPLPTTSTEDSASAELTIQQTEGVAEPLHAEEEVKLKPKKIKKTKELADGDVDIKKTKKKKDDDLQQGEFTVTKTKKPKTVVQEIEEEFTFDQPNILNEPEEEIKNILLKRLKPTKLISEESVEAIVQLGAIKDELVDVPSEEKVQLKLGRRSMKPFNVEDIEVDATISTTKQDEPNDYVAQEFTIKKKPNKQPTPVIEEHADEFTVKKLKKKQRVIDIPGYTDTENVTFRPRSTKTTEDVDQEFQIHLDSYAEEEVSMSGKVKLRKTRPLTYSEEAGEANIKITEKYDDGEGPIIEEIDDDFSEPEDTMYDVDEPEEFSDIEDLPKEVEVTLKTKKKKPQYRVEDNEEEDVSIHTVRRKQKQQATYDEDSLTLKKPPKRKPSTYLEGYYNEIYHALYTLCLQP